MSSMHCSSMLAIDQASSFSFDCIFERFTSGKQFNLFSTALFERNQFLCLIFFYSFGRIERETRHTSSLQTLNGEQIRCENWKHLGAVFISRNRHGNLFRENKETISEHLWTHDISIFPFSILFFFFCWMTFRTYQRYFTNDFRCVRIAATRAKCVENTQKNEYSHDCNTQGILCVMNEAAATKAILTSSSSSTNTYIWKAFDYKRSHKELEDTHTSANIKREHKQRICLTFDFNGCHSSRRNHGQHLPYVRSLVIAGNW